MVFRCGCDEGAWRRVVGTRRELLRSGASAAVVALAGPALLNVARTSAQGTPPSPSLSPSATDGVASGQRAVVFNSTSFINPLVELYGDIAVGERCYVAGNTLLLADEGCRIALGDENNCQDNAYLLARERNLVTGDMVSIAHQAVIENSTIGDFTFFGFRCRVRNATIEEGAMILHQTRVENVTIPANRIVPVGAQILTQADADALPELETENVEFKEDVQGVNLEFAAGNIQLFEELGIEPLTGVGPNPITSWNPERIDPSIGEGTELGELVRVVGDVRLGADSTVGQRTAIRADEGSPIIIGRRARIQSRVTFHALLESNIAVGDDAQIGDGNVIHGPVTLGNNFVSEDDCVVFRATVEDNVTIRAGATIAGELTLREGMIVPEQSVILTQEEADALPVV